MVVAGSVVASWRWLRQGSVSLNGCALPKQILVRGLRAERHDPQFPSPFTLATPIAHASLPPQQAIAPSRLALTLFWPLAKPLRSLSAGPPARRANVTGYRYATSPTLQQQAGGDFVSCGCSRAQYSLTTQLARADRNAHISDEARAFTQPPLPQIHSPPSDSSLQMCQRPRSIVPSPMTE